MGLVARGMLSPEPEIEPMSLALAGASLNHWITREVLVYIFTSIFFITI